MRLAPLLLAALLAPAAAATDVKVTAHGTVVYNQIKTAPLDTVKGGHKVELSFLLDSADFVNGATTPTRGYAIDQDSFKLAFKTATVALQSPFPAGETPYFVIRNNDPVVDGFFISRDVGGPNALPVDVVGAFGNYTIHFLATYGGTKLSSLDLLGAVGTHDFTGMTVFGFRMEDGPVTPMEIDFESLTIEAVAWADKGHALAGVAGNPQLVASGDLSAGSANALTLANAAPAALAGLVAGLTSANLPFKGGTLVPAMNVRPVFMPVSAGGSVALPFTMPAGLAAGTELWVQWAILDAAAAKGVALSNALLGVTP